MSNTPSKAEIEALVKRHGATSYRNRADTQHPAYGFTEDGLNGLIDEVLAKWGTPRPSPAPGSDDSALLDWIAIHGSFGVDSSTGKVGGNGQKCVAATRKNIRAAIAAQGGSNAE